MPTEPLVPAPGPPSEEHYRAFCALLSQSERGRRLLAEHARRTRQPDTETLLAAIMRIELRLKADASVAHRLRDDLRMLLVAIRMARPEIDTAGPVTQVTKLKLLLDLLERRLDALAGTAIAAAAPTDKTAPALLGAARGHFAVVPRPDEPELPISAPDAQAPRHRRRAERRDDACDRLRGEQVRGRRVQDSECASRRAGHAGV